MSSPGVKRCAGRSRSWRCRNTHRWHSVSSMRRSTASGTPPETARPISASTPNAPRLPGSMAPPCFIGWRTARRDLPTRASFSIAVSPMWPASVRRAAVSRRLSIACQTRSDCCVRCAERSSAVGDQPGDMAHLAAGLDLGFAVQMELYQRVVERLAPLLDVIAEEVLHHRVGVMLDRAERQTAHRPHELLELARNAG